VSVMPSPRFLTVEGSPTSKAWVGARSRLNQQRPATRATEILPVCRTRTRIARTCHATGPFSVIRPYGAPASVRARWTRLQAPDSGRLHRVTDGFKDRPDTTFGTVNADVLAHFGPGFQRIDFVEVILSSSWPE
jgi:hypothetical protein